MKRLFLFSATLFFLFAGAAHAQELVLDKHVTLKAKVIEVVESETRKIPGLDVSSVYQTIRAEILSGAEAGKIVLIKNDHLELDRGETFFLVHSSNELEHWDTYTVSEPYRISALLFFALLFVVSVLVFGGKQGIRGLLALCLSFFFIAYLLLPGIMVGYSPILVSMGVSSLIIIIGSYITHGVNRMTTAAVLGMMATIFLSGFLAFWAIDFTRLSGIANEEATYLDFNTGGRIDFAGLLLGSILIGLLGVLYDAAIGQAVAVLELKSVGVGLSRWEIYKRAQRIGREHVGALVNTLAIAYVGASLPLFLLFYGSSDAGFTATINLEVFAAEIIRILISSIGLVLSVPITNLVATFMLVRSERPKGPDVID